MIICNSRRFIYFHLHKCGGTSVETALEPSMQWNDILLGSTPFGEVANDYYGARFGLSKHSSVADAERVCGSMVLNTYDLLATVRHPVARVCSLYNYLADLWQGLLDRFGLTHPELVSRYDEMKAQEPILEWSAMQAFANSPDFARFVRDGRLDDDPGFRTQVERLATASGRMPVHWFRLEDQLPRLQLKLWDSARIRVQIPVTNSSTTRRATPSGLAASDLSYLRERFREDYEAFGYRSESV